MNTEDWHLNVCPLQQNPVAADGVTGDLASLMDRHGRDVTGDRSFTGELTLTLPL